MGVESGFAAVNGTRLYYEVAGEGTPVALIHGFTLDTRMWDDQFLPLAAHYRVVRYDARGFGRSDLPTGEPYSPHDDLRALLEHLGLGPAAITGLSMGGGIAADFAIAHPDATRALVLLDAALGGHRFSPGWGAASKPIWAAAREEGVAAAKERWLAHDLFAPAHEQPAVAARLATIVGDYSGWHWLNRDTARGVEPPALARPNAITAPTLAIIGERDVPDFHAMAATLKEGLPNARLVTIPGVGHMANMEAPQAVNRAILDFLRDVL
jgi:pimeloyl-ACP methyl ester carboxylesterase